MTDPRWSIMALAPQNWHDPWVNRQQLFSRIGRHHSVLYSTGGWFVWDIRSDDWRRADFFGRITATDNVLVDESPRFLMRWPRIRSVDRTVMRWQVQRWTRRLRKHGNLPLLAQICHPAYFPYIDMLKPKRVVYHVYEQYDHMPGFSAEMDRFERALLRQADLVFCASQLMADALFAKVPREIKVLPNAADVALFNKAAARGSPTPADLAQIPNPRIGWIGSLHPQMDYALVSTLAKRRPDWHFVFVGYKVAFTDNRSEQDYLECTKLENVHFLGYKNRDDVPQYAMNMDVNAMWYRLSDETWVKAGSPLKLHENLAAGRPVVAANMPSVARFSNVVRIAEGADDWEAAIDEALSTGGRGTPELRKTVAAENSWDARAETLRQWLANLARP